jgi:lysophospholipase L1-like esterase
MKNALQNLLLLLLTTLACAGLAEIVVRAVVAPPPLIDPATTSEGVQRIVMFDDKLETRYRPDSRAVIRSQYGEFEVTYEINELGLRDRPRGARPPNGRTVLALGNSIVEGWGVAAEQGFVRLAERRLATRGAAVELINGGIAGYGGAQSYLLFQALRARVQPDAIVFIYISTMPHFDHQYLSRAELDSRQLTVGLSVDAVLNAGQSAAPPTESDAAISPRLRMVANWSALVRVVVLSQMTKADRARVKPGDPATDLLAGMRGDASMLPAIHEPSLRHVAAIAEAAARDGIPFLFVHVPLPHQLSGVEWDLGRAAYNLDKRAYGSADRPVVEAFCREAKLHCAFAHDALAARVAQSPAATRLYYRYDFHPNETGNAALGEWLAEQIAALNFSNKGPQLSRR